MLVNAIVTFPPLNLKELLTRDSEHKARILRNTGTKILRKILGIALLLFCLSQPLPKSDGEIPLAIVRR